MAGSRIGTSSCTHYAPILTVINVGLQKLGRKVPGADRFSWRRHRSAAAMLRVGGFGTVRQDDAVRGAGRGGEQDEEDAHSYRRADQLTQRSRELTPVPCRRRCR